MLLVTKSKIALIRLKAKNVEYPVRMKFTWVFNDNNLLFTKQSKLLDHFFSVTYGNVVSITISVTNRCQHCKVMVNV